MIMVTVGQKIREIRVAKRLTQEQIEQRTGIKREYLSKIETGGLPNITIKTLKKITDALGVPLSRFFREANN
jgi:transcriptional regulator with XRE-family HTH domain